MRYIAFIGSVLLLLFLSLGRSSAEVLPDTLSTEARFGIMIVEPSSEAVYTVYGHAGFRVQDLSQGLDVVFNYGLFQFDDSFLYRFIQGKTDYFGAPEYTTSFISGYTERGSNVRELVLNLSPQVRQNLWGLLIASIQPETREYRYNFFLDNCATRPVNLLLQALQGTRLSSLEPTELTHTTWRSQINLMERHYPWLLLGTDLALGAPTDRKISQRESCFLPSNVESYIDRVMWQEADSLANMHSLLDSVIYYPSKTSDVDLPSSVWSYLLHPSFVFGLLLLLALVLVWYGGFSWRILEGGFFLVGGLAGTLLFYIALLSEHPSVWPNYNLVVLHPLHLIMFILLIVRARYWAYCYHFANFALQAIFLVVAYFLPQSFNLVVYMLSVSFLLLSLGGIWRFRLEKRGSTS